MGEQVEVTEGDREIAASMMDIQGGPNTMPSYVRMGQDDHHPVVQAFARHRLAAEAAAQARMAEMEAALQSVHAARLRRDGTDPGYGWNITALNRAINAALSLLGREVPTIDVRTASIAEDADRIAKRMGGRFDLHALRKPDATDGEEG